VRQTGNIINDLIPHVYDTERTIRIMGEDGKIDVMAINTARGTDPQSGETLFAHDITAGSYDVVATMGPSYTTRREEARDGMTSFIQAAPQTAPLVLDLIAKAQDWPMADDIAKRMRATLPPKILQLEVLEKQGATPEQIDQFLANEPAPPPDPKLVKVQQDGQLAMAKMQAEQQSAMAALQLELRRMAEDSKRAQDELMAKLQAMLVDAKTRIEVAQINVRATAGAASGPMG
jgi:Phage P22-like portal protein